MNMNKEYLAELDQLQKAERKLVRDLRIARRLADQATKRLQRDVARAQKATDRDLEKINRRRAILEGRLS